MGITEEKSRYRREHKLQEHQKVVDRLVGSPPDIGRSTPDQALKSYKSWLDKIKRDAMSMNMYDIIIVDVTNMWDEMPDRDYAVIGTVTKTQAEIDTAKRAAAARAESKRKRQEAQEKGERNSLRRLAEKHPDLLKELARGKP